MPKATFTAGVYGCACWNDNSLLKIKVNVRTDQIHQRELVGLPTDSDVLIIDLPGGGAMFEDFVGTEKGTLFAILQREIEEETGGCTIKQVGLWSQPYMAIKNEAAKQGTVGDLAFWTPIVLSGRPVPTDEALDHPWITLRELETEDKYRTVGGLGNLGRTARMLREAFEFFLLSRLNLGMFTDPQ